MSDKLLQFIRFIMVCHFFIFSLSGMAQTTYKVTAQKLNVRSAPTQRSTIIGSLTKGTVISVESIKDNWAAFSYKGKTGYVSSSFLEVIKDDSSSMPVPDNKIAKEKDEERKATQVQSESRYTQKQESPKFIDYGKYDKIPGFAMSSDLMLGYRNKTVSINLGYDFGYQANRVLYFGAGPQLAVGINEVSTSFSGGVYGKMRATMPVESSVRPMFDLRGGYIYDFDAKKGNPFLGFGLGVNITKRLNVGIQGTITWWTEKKDTVTGAMYNNTYKKEEIKKLHLQFTPSIFVSYDIGKSNDRHCYSDNRSKRQRTRKGNNIFKSIAKAIDEVYPSIEVGGSYYLDKMTQDNGRVIASQFLGDLKAVCNFRFSENLAIGAGVGADIDFSSVDIVMPLFLRGKYLFLDNSSTVRPFAQFDFGTRIKVRDGENNLAGGLLVEPALGVQYKKVYASLGFTSYKVPDYGVGYSSNRSQEAKGHNALNLMLGVDF